MRINGSCCPRLGRAFGAIQEPGRAGLTDHSSTSVQVRSAGPVGSSTTTFLTAFTDDELNHSYPAVRRHTEGLPYPDQYGLPFELSISGFLANHLDGRRAQVSGCRTARTRGRGTTGPSWTRGLTDPETGDVWDVDSGNDYAGQYMPQMYTNGLKKPFDDGLTKTMFDRA